MFLRCHLREIRDAADLSIRDVAEATGINRGNLSAIERGRLLPTEAQVALIEGVYGKPRTEWYAPIVLAAITHEDESS